MYSATDSLLKSPMIINEVGGDVIFQLYMAQILKQGPTTWVTHTMHKYTFHGANNVSVLG